MKNKIIGLFVCTLLIATTVLPASGTSNINGSIIKEKSEISSTSIDPNWEWAVNGGGGDDYDIYVDSAGNSYVTGWFEGSATFGGTTLTSNGNSDVFVAKLDTNGNWLWAISAGGDSGDQGYGVSVDPNGFSYVTGFFMETATFGSTTLVCNGKRDIFVAKLNTTGTNWLWAKSAGAIEMDHGLAISVDSNGNSYITGDFEGSVSFGSFTPTIFGGRDMFVAKLNTNGDWQWAKSAGSTSNSECGYRIGVDSNSNVYVTGRFYGQAYFGPFTLTSSGSFDIFVAKLNTAGAWQWAESAGGNIHDAGWGICVDSSGSSYVTGHFMGSSTFGGIPLTGNSAKEDVFVAKIDTNGVWQWAAGAGGTGLIIGKEICVDPCGNSYITGHFQGPVNFGTISLVPSGNSDVFVAKLDAPGNTWQWAINPGPCNGDAGRGIGIDSFDNLYVTGQFSCSINFGSHTLSSVSGDVFVAKLVDNPLNFAKDDGIADDKCVNRGETIKYTLTFDNPYSYDLTSVTIIDTLPDEVQFQNHAHPSFWSYTPGSPATIKWDFGTIPPGSCLCWIEVKVKQDCPLNTTFCNYANITSNETACPITVVNCTKVCAEDPNNNPPFVPDLTTTNPSQIPIGMACPVKIIPYDQDGNPMYLWIDWGDGTDTGWIGPYPSDKEATVNHTWTEKGTYIIKAKAEDIYGAEGPWGNLTVTVPRNIAFNFNFSLLSWLFERFPLLERLLSFVR